MSTPIIRYEEHSTRLFEIEMAIKFSLSAMETKADSLKGDPKIDAAFAQMGSGFEKILESVRMDDKDRASARKAHKSDLNKFKDVALGGFHARELLLNIGLVMLCTQLEVFINHLLDVVLAAEPRKILDLAPDKELSAKEVLDLGNYDAVMQRVRDKIVDEVDRAGTRDKFSKHLGQRFKLIDTSQIRIVPPQGVDPSQFKDWNIDRLDQVFGERHRIVHRGELLIQDSNYLSLVSLFFKAIQTTLTINAVRGYPVVLDSRTSAAMALGVAKMLCGFHKSSLKEFEEKTRGMFPLIGAPD